MDWLILLYRKGGCSVFGSFVAAWLTILMAQGRWAWEPTSLRSVLKHFWLKQMFSILYPVYMMAIVLEMFTKMGNGQSCKHTFPKHSLCRSRCPVTPIRFPQLL
uniref:Uncharacterized protein n=1 Tax=Cacopsylla melanoneura TaxID=428564 RepID=A0A8D8R0J4_9HEMI